MSNILEVCNLCIYDKKSKTMLLENINFKLKEGDIFGIIGESGSGKSILCRAILGLNPDYFEISGKMLFEDIDLSKASKHTLQQIRGKKISIIIQDAINAFNPIKKIQAQIVESLKGQEELLKTKINYKDWLLKVGLKDIEKVLNSYPFELSGGMLQRVMIALAFAQNSKLIIADEPTSSIDVINQKEILNLLKNLQEKEKKTVIFVSHDLGVVSYLANNLAVMKKGKIVEQNSAKLLFTNPQDEYSKYLIKASKTIFESCNRCLK